MITVLFRDNKEKIREIISQFLGRIENANIGIVKEGDVVKIIEEDGLRNLVTLKEKIIELEDALLKDKKGVIYKSVLEAIEKTLLERMLEYVEGNQLKAARFLGINRNTMRMKIKKLGIDCQLFRIKNV